MTLAQLAVEALVHLPTDVPAEAPILMPMEASVEVAPAARPVKAAAAPAPVASSAAAPAMAASPASERVQAAQVEDELRRFGYVSGGSAAGVGVVAWTWLGSPTLGVILLMTGAVLLALAVQSPMTLVPVRRQWRALSPRLAKLATPLFLGVAFIGLFMPIGWLRRKLGAPALEHSLGSGNLWKPVGKETSTQGPS